MRRIRGVKYRSEVENLEDAYEFNKEKFLQKEKGDLFSGGFIARLSGSTIKRPRCQFFMDQFLTFYGSTISSCKEVSIWDRTLTVDLTKNIECLCEG